MSERNLGNINIDKMQTVVKILQENHALKEIPGQTHAGIGTIPKDPVSVLNFSDLNV